MRHCCSPNTRRAFTAGAAGELLHGQPLASQLLGAPQHAAAALLLLAAATAAPFINGVREGDEVFGPFTPDAERLNGARRAWCHAWAAALCYSSRVAARHGRYEGALAFGSPASPRLSRLLPAVPALILTPLTPVAALLLTRAQARPQLWGSWRCWL